MYAEVQSVERLTPGLIRIVFFGGELKNFESTLFTDQYINGYFLPESADYLVPFDLAEVRSLGDGLRPRPRRVTVRKWDDTNRQLTVDFVVHGQAGYAGPWAQRAQPGDRLQFKGPSGSYRPNPDVDWHLFAGDETALPAISASLESLSSESKCTVFVLVDSKSHEVNVDTEAQVEFCWLHRESAINPTNALLEALKEYEFKNGSFDVFVHGEAGEVRALRKYLLSEYAVDPASSSISPYWRRDHTDEAWREIKKEWLADQAADV
ncbi:MAG: NADPH-dependent ferric siderophore reductase [Acidimicrobiaceae bacterium]|nr:NADPH-dependent ferric siderophore reductase [Acidimicrobiaceae bacterium]